MFICDITGKVSQPGEKAIRIVTENREKNYFERRYQEETDEYEFVQVGRGLEIVRELRVSAEGHKAWLDSGATVITHSIRS